MKHTVTTIVVLIIVGVVIGVWILPERSDIALMYLEDGQYEPSLRIYEKLYAQGDRSIKTVIPLSRLYFKTGEIDRSIDILQDVVKSHSDSVPALDQLASSYRKAQRPSDYIATLGRIADLNPDTAILRELAELYEVTQDRENNARALEKLIHMPGYKLEENDYIRLIAFYARNRNLTRASELIQELLAKKQTKEVADDYLEFFLHIMLDAKHVRKALDLGRQQIQLVPTPKRARMVISLFLARKLSGETLGLLAEGLKLYPNDQELQLLSLNARLDQGEEDSVYQELLDKSRRGSLPAGQMDILTRLALKRHQFAEAAKLIKQTPPEQFSDDVLFNFAFFLLVNHQKDWAKQLSDQLGADFLQYEPLLRTLIASTLKGETVSDMTRNFLLQDDSIQANRMKLARLLYDGGYLGDCLRLIRDLNPSTMIAVFSPSELATVLASHGKPEKYLDSFKQEADRGLPNSDLLKKARFQIAACSGNTAIVHEYLQAANRSDTQDVVDAFFMAEDRGKLATASYLANYLYRTNPTASNRFYLARTLTELERYPEAMKHLLELVDTEREVEPYFLSVSSKLMTTDKIGFLKKHGAVLNKVLDRMLSRKDPTAPEAREAGYVLAQIGRKNAAEEVLLQLCQRPERTPADLAELLSIAGETPSSKTATWLREQAVSAKGSLQRYQWLSYLADAKQYKQVVATIDDVYGGVTNDSIDLYALSLQALGKETELSQVIGKLKLEQLKQLRPTQRARFVAIFFDQGKFDVAYELYKTVPVDEVLPWVTPAEIAVLFRKVGKGKEGMELFRELASRSQNPDFVRLLYDTMGGDATKLSQLLANPAKVTDLELQQVFYMASEYGLSELALTSSKILFERQKSDTNRVLYAEALLNTKRYKEVLDLLLDAKIKTTQARYLYLAAYLGENQQKKFGQDSQYTKVFLSLCEEALTANKFSADMKRDTGYILFDAGFSDKSRRIFFELAGTEPFSSPDVEQLLFLIGNQPNSAELAWLKKRSGERTPDQRQWLRELNRLGESEFVADLVKSQYAKKVPKRLTDVYLNSLLLSGRLDDFDRVVTQEDVTLGYNQDELLGLLDVLYRARTYKRQATATMRKIPIEVLLKESDPIIVADLAVFAENATQCEKQIRELMSTGKIDQKVGQKTIFLIQCGLGKPISTASLPKDTETIDAGFSLAVTYGRPAAALALAQELMKLAPSGTSRLLLIEALIMNKEYEQAIERMAEKVVTDPELEPLAFAAFAGLQKEKGSEALAPYKSLVDKLEQRVLARPSIDPELRREMGYFYSEMQQYERALRMFMPLVVNEPPDHPDVEQFVYLLESYAWPEGVELVASRARTDTGERQILWLKYLNDISKPQAVINILGKEFHE